jgi:signal transduction histidine kinase
MFRNLSTGTKLLILCGAFIVSIAIPIYGLVAEKQIAIEFAHNELVGNRYLVTVRDIYSTLIAAPQDSTMAEPPIDHGDTIRRGLAELASGAVRRLDTPEFAGRLATTLHELELNSAAGANEQEHLAKALSEAQSLAQRIGDASNLALDPDLDSYYVQNIVVRRMPGLLSRLTELQQFFETSVSGHASSLVHQVRLPILASQVASEAGEIREDLDAAYRGNPDGSLKQAVEFAFAAMFSSIDSYLGTLDASKAGLDARDMVAYNHFHIGTAQKAIKSWTLAQFQLNRLLQKRIDNLLGKMHWGLALIGTFVGLSIIVAALTHRHIVRPLQRLEAVASAVRQKKDYNLRVDDCGQDEIGRVTSAFNEMLSELAAARGQEIAERAESARVARLISMGEMAASIAHEINQPLSAIVTNANAGLRWLSAATPDIGRLEVILKRVVRDGLRASDVVASVRAMLKRGPNAMAPLNVNELIEEVVGLVREDLQIEQILLQLRLDKMLPSVLADRVQLHQVLLNLVSNAIDAMREVRDRPRELWISTETMAPDGVLVAVADSGVGIDPKDDDRIFEAFFTTKANGMGLGLPICRSIIEAHGGRLRASRGSPHGSVFQFTLFCKGGAL